jgi:hypothetical protein
MIEDDEKDRMTYGIRQFYVGSLPHVERRRPAIFAASRKRKVQGAWKWSSSRFQIPLQLYLVRVSAGLVRCSRFSFLVVSSVFIRACDI